MSWFREGCSRDRGSVCVSFTIHSRRWWRPIQHTFQTISPSGRHAGQLTPFSPRVAFTSSRPGSFTIVSDKHVCATLTPMISQVNAIVTGLTAVVLLYTRSIGVAYFGVGAVACTISVKCLKQILRHARPVQTTNRRQKQTYGYVAEADDFGCSFSIPRPSRMPSTHSATITFYGTYIPFACAWLPLHASLPESPLFRPIVAFMVIPWTCAIAWSRVMLGHHTAPQVVVGCVYGFAFACVWFWLWTHGLGDLAWIIESHVRTYIEL